MSRKYARGAKAWGECQRCGGRFLLDQLVFDGELPNMRVCLGCWDPRHPQEYLQALDDPVALFRPSPENLNAPTAPVLSGSGSVVRTAPAAVALLHFDLASGQVDGSTVFTDESGKTWTAGGAAQIDTSQSKFGGASGQFTVTTDSLTTAASSDFNFGTGDFTVQCFFRAAGTISGNQIIIEFRSNTVENHITIVFDATNKVRVEVGGGTVFSSANGVIVPLTWQHLAMVRFSSVTTLYIDGVSIGTFADTNSYPTSTCGLSIVRQGGSDVATFVGHIDEFRVTKGFAEYTGNFTPPTSAGVLTPPDDDTADLSWTAAESDVSQISRYELWRSTDGAGFTLITTKTVERDFIGTITNDAASRSHTDTGLDISNHDYSYYVIAYAVQGGSARSNTITLSAEQALTSLLIQAETALTVRTGAATIQIIGDGVISTSQSIFGDKSFFNPGTSTFGTDYIRAQSPAGYFLFPGEFTWDGWFYPTAYVNTFMNVYSNDINFPDAGFIQVAILQSGQVLWNSRPGDSIVWGSGPDFIHLNQWTHIAITRDAANKLHCFFNGHEIGQTGGNVVNATILGTLGGNFLGASNFTIGRGQASDNGDFQGFFDEIRVVNGLAVYTGDFTPPTEPYLPQI